MNEYIKKCYMDFIDFMGIQNKKLPQINPVINTNENNTAPIAFVNTDEISYPVTNVYYNLKLFTYNQEYIKTILFHEFTHMLDYLTCKSEFLNENDFIAFMSLYSEYHASKIELACNVGCKNFQSKPKMDIKETFVIHKNTTCSIENTYLEPMASALTIIDKPSNAYFNLAIDDYYRKYKNFEAYTMYFLGKRDFCMIISTKPFPDILEKQYGEFSSYITNILQCIRTKNFSMFPHVRKELWNKFLSTYNSKYFLELKRIEI